MRLAEADFPAGDYAHPVFGEGDPACGVVLIGEAPGREEAESGRPFVGKAGRQLDALLDSAGIDRERVYVTNAVKYRPVKRGERSVKNRTPGREELAEALPLVREQLAVLRPRVIVTLGNTPLNALLTVAGVPVQTVGALHGAAFPIRLAYGDAALFPLYHPASAIYNPSLLPVLRADAAALGEHLVKAGL